VRRVLSRAISIRACLTCLGALAVSLCLLNSSFLFAQEQNQQQQSPFPPGEVLRVSVDSVNVGVLVTDSHGAFIGGLQRNDFRVFDNGVERPLTGFSESNEPAQILFLIESSPSVYFLRGGHLAAAYRLLNQLAPTDRVAIVTYSNAPNLILNFTADKSAAFASLQATESDFTMGNPGLNLSASLAATLNWLSTLPGEKTIVLLSSGIDSSAGLYKSAGLSAIATSDASVKNKELMDRVLGTSDTRVLAISLLNDLRAAPKELKHSSLSHVDRAWLQQGFANADQSMREFSQATGGRFYFPRTASDLDHAVADIVKQTRHEYVLSFDASSRDGQLHSIRVKVKHSPQRVAYRQAYLAPPPSH
jgi:Ca-activated chloride channel family protein